MFKRFKETIKKRWLDALAFIFFAALWFNPTMTTYEKSVVSIMLYLIMLLKNLSLQFEIFTEHLRFVKIIQEHSNNELHQIKKLLEKERFHETKRHLQ